MHGQRTRLACGLLLSLLSAGAGSCLHPHSMVFRDSSGDIVLTKEFHFDGTGSIIDAVDEAQQLLGKTGSDMRIQILEQLLRYASSGASARDITHGEMFVRVDDASRAQEKLRVSAAALGLLSADALPARIWSTASSPAFQIVLDGGDEYMTAQIMTAGGYYLYDQIKIVTEAARNKLSRPGVFVDVGANMGMLALFAAACGEAVVAFEATAATAQRLKASCMINGWCPLEGNPAKSNSFVNNSRFSIFENAVSAIDAKQVTMRVNWLRSDNLVNGGGNYVMTEADNSVSAGAIETQVTITLDTALSSLGLVPEIDSVAADFKPTQYISMLKLDCEGCEPSALLGATRLFEHNPPLSMLIEINTERLHAVGSSPILLLQQIEQLGYDIIESATGRMMSPVSEQVIMDILIGEHDAFDVFATLRSFGWSLVN